MNLSALSLSSALEQIRRREFSPLELADACLDRIKMLNPRLNAFITVTEEIARVQADQAEQQMDQRQSDLEHLDLLGIPIGLKDLFETAGVRTTAGSLFFADHVPGEDAQVVRKLKDAGAVLPGKTNTHEIALGVTTNNPHFGACRNPWDPSRVPGGSSGGSAVAVATGMCLAALGTDTGGSIRIPAALCGVVGLKPTYGRVSLRGVIPLSWNLDHVGPLTRTVQDAARLLAVISGYDPHDPASVDVPLDDPLAGLEAGIKGWRVGLGVGEYLEVANGEVRSAVEEAAKSFKQLGARVVKVEMDWLEVAAQANSRMTQADGAAYHRERLAEHPEWFGADVLERLQAGESLSSTEYALARRTQAEVRRRFDLFFEMYDLLILPTTPIVAPLITGTQAVEAARQLTRFTSPFNLAGLPALSLPCGFSRDHLPIGLQIVARAWGENQILRAGHAYQKCTNWHDRRPPI